MSLTLLTHAAELEVAVTELAVHEDPTSFSRITARLPFQTRVSTSDQRLGWSRVSFEVEGTIVEGWTGLAGLASVNQGEASRVPRRVFLSRCVDGAQTLLGAVSAKGELQHVQSADFKRLDGIHWFPAEWEDDPYARPNRPPSPGTWGGAPTRDGDEWIVGGCHDTRLYATSRLIRAQPAPLLAEDAARTISLAIANSGDAANVALTASVASFSPATGFRLASISLPSERYACRIPWSEEESTWTLVDDTDHVARTGTHQGPPVAYWLSPARRRLLVHIPTVTPTTEGASLLLIDGHQVSDSLDVIYRRQEACDS